MPSISSRSRRGHHKLRNTFWVCKEGKGKKVSRLAKLPRDEAQALIDEGKAVAMKREVVKRLLRESEGNPDKGKKGKKKS